MVGRGGIYGDHFGDGREVMGDDRMLNAQDRPSAVTWAEKKDQFSDRIISAHPMESRDDDRHIRYALAMEMIHNRHGKYALVDLVNWLLTKWPELQNEAKR